MFKTTDFANFTDFLADDDVEITPKKAVHGFHLCNPPKTHHVKICEICEICGFEYTTRGEKVIVYET